MRGAPKSRAVVYAGLAIFGLVILIFGDWISALVYALIVIGAALVEWLLGRWNWFENRRVRRAIDMTSLEAHERREQRGPPPVAGAASGEFPRHGGDGGGGVSA